MYTLESFGKSHVGLTRSNNEDVFATLPDKHFFVLADGMGGHRAGEVAAQKAVEYICNEVSSFQFQELRKITHFLRKTLQEASAHVWQLSRKVPGYAGMGTTLSCFAIHEGLLFYAHVGDSRLYRFRPDRAQVNPMLHQLTLDHSLKASYADLGCLPIQRHGITRALGTSPYVIADLGVISLASQDIYFLCSDGLTDVVPDEQLHQILAQGAQVSEAVSTFIDTALEKGGHDNITVLMTKVM